MSLGGRIVKGGRTGLSASGALFWSPREPLLFLYPQWIRTNTASAQVLDDGGIRKALSIGHDHLPRPASCSDSEPFSENAAVKYQNDEKLAGREQRSALPAQKGKILRNDKVVTPSDMINTTTTHRESNGTAGNAVIRRILAKERKRGMRKEYDRQAREDYEEKKMAERMDGAPNWRDILHGLESYTLPDADYWQRNVLKIEVPSKAVGQLLFSEDDNIWAIKMRCGCQIEISEADEASKANRVVRISGPVRNITKAAIEILRVVPHAVSDNKISSQREPSFNTISTTKGSSLSEEGLLTQNLRRVPTELRQRLAKPIRADRVARPTSWTSESFGLYVQNLTSIKMSSHIQKIMYDSGENHTDAVVSTLRSLFVDPQCRKAISTAAFNNTLAYLVKHNAIHVVRDLFVCMEMQSLKMNTETFNIMLRGAAKSKSIGNFHHIFWLMIRRGYSPNADTWLAFIRAMDNPQIKAHILKGMQSKELLHDPRIQKEVVEEFIEMDVTSSLDNNTVHEQFVTQMVDRYGQDWLTTDSANRIIDALGVRGLISRCGDFLEFMHSKDVKLSEASILTVLHHCEKQDNPQGALEIIRRVSSLIDFRPTEAIYHSIFNIAWEARLHCVARVVWHYACLNAATTYLMRRRICAGLDTAILKSSSSQSAALKFLPRKEWAATACRFILLVPSQISKRDGVILSDDIGDIRPPTSYRGTIHASTSAFEGNLAAAENSVENLEDRLSPAEEISNNVRKSTRRSLSEEIVWEQLHAFQFWTPQRHFTDILMEAFETDMEMASSIGGTADNRLEWLAQRAPAMPLYEKKRALPNWYSKRGYLRPRVQPLLKRA